MICIKREKEKRGEGRKEERRSRNARKTMRETNINADSLWQSPLRKEVLGATAMLCEISYFIAFGCYCSNSINSSLLYILMKYRLEKKKRWGKGFYFLFALHQEAI